MVTCSSCGAHSGAESSGAGAAADAAGDAAEVPLGWMVEHERTRGRSVVCPACVRRHARSIEAKLERAWW